jgi:hypothetical protein
VSGRLCRKPDEDPTVSNRHADGCEGSHDCVGAKSKLDDRERFVKKRKCVATLQRAAPRPNASKIGGLALELRARSLSPGLDPAGRTAALSRTIRRGKGLL